jgi:hypothetical protein
MLDPDPVSSRKRRQEETVSDPLSRGCHAGDVGRTGPRKSPEEIQVEDRVRAHVRQYMVRKRIGLNRLADRLGMHKGTLSKILYGGGVDAHFLWRLRSKLHLDLNDVIEEPIKDESLYRPGPPPIPDEAEGEPPTSSASAPTAESRKRSRGGGSVR